MINYLILCCLFFVLGQDEREEAVEELKDIELKYNELKVGLYTLMR